MSGDPPAVVLLPPLPDAGAARLSWDGAEGIYLLLVPGLGVLRMTPAWVIRLSGAADVPETMALGRHLGWAPRELPAWARCVRRYTYARRGDLYRFEALSTERST